MFIEHWMAIEYLRATIENVKVVSFSIDQYKNV